MPNHAKIERPDRPGPPCKVLALVLALLLALWSVPAAAERRVALVIGNAAYVHAPVLDNPVHDARALASALARLGFEVLTGLDQTADQMRSTLRAFSAALERADVALFFYAGHGIQLGGRNHLIPVDADITREADVDFATLELDLILAQMERAAATRIVLLDACRNNPFETRLTRAMGQSRSATHLGRGLAPVDSDGGAFIGFATDPGAVAFDGTGRHSPFTRALLDHIEVPGLELNAMMTRVRADVFAATGRLQRPWSTSSLLREVYLAPQQEPLAATEDPRLVDLAAWQAISGSTDAQAFRRYLEDHPQGLFRDLAQARLAALAPAPVPDTVPEPGPTLAAVVPPQPDPPPSPVVPDGNAPDHGRGPQPAAPSCDRCPATVSIAAGNTVLGGTRRGEGPATRQSLPAYALAVAEVTVGDIRAFEQATGRAVPRGCHVWTETGRMRRNDRAYWGDPGFPVTEDSPAACLSWDDAMAYVAWLNTIDPRGGWRLPSEAEFEFAARAGQDGDYPWGGGVDALCANANGAGAETPRFSWRNRACSDGAATPQPAGTFPPNALGLDSMIGNLWEWTADCWNETHAGAFADGRARTSGTCASRVLRGGSWDDPPDNLRVTYRVGIPKTRRQANVGLRVARDLP